MAFTSIPISKIYGVVIDVMSPYYGISIDVNQWRLQCLTYSGEDICSMSANQLLSI